MSLQHEKAMPLPSRRGLLPSIFLALVFALAGCGGGGGGGDGTPTDGTTAGITYTGNTNPASITTTNASALVGNLIGGASVAEATSNVQPAAAREPAGWSGVVSVLDRLLSRTRGVAATSATGGLDYHAAASVPVDETVPCDSGSMILSGSLDDQTGRGTLTLTFDACTTDGETWNGTGTFRVDAMDLTYFEITDGLMTFPSLTITGAEVDISMSFDVRLQVVIGDNLERLTMNLVTRDNGTGEMLKYENLVEENVYAPSVLSPSSYTQIVRGRMYDSTDGYVDVITPEVSPFSFSSLEQIYPDTGVLVLTGAVSNLRLSTESNARVVVDLDSDGDGVHETGVTLLWDEFGEPIAADIGDNDGDGMHNSWETTYGLNPEDSTDALLDTDGDGVSNYQEYLDRSDPNTGLLEVASTWSLSGFGFAEPYRGQTFQFPQAVTAQSLTVFVASAIDPIEFHILIVEMDTTNVDTTNVVYPTRVLFESDTVSLPPVNTTEMTPITVDLGGISLAANQTYGWLLDAFVTNVPEHVNASTGTELSDIYADGFMFSLTSGPFGLPGTREDHFAGGFGATTYADMTFRLEYKLE